MKRFTLVLFIVIGLAGAAKADLFTTDGINVGGLDSFVSAASLKNSGDKTELEWVKDVLKRTDITLNAKYPDKTSSWIWENTNQEGTWALRFLTNAPEYFLIKTGRLDGTDSDTFLFHNDANLNWAVVRLSTSPKINLQELGKFSHIVEFNDKPTSVPEPATMLLLGFGLIGMAAFRRKAKKS